VGPRAGLVVLERRKITVYAGKSKIARLRDMELQKTKQFECAFKHKSYNKCCKPDTIRKNGLY
jgi:hypothetical protein